MVLDGIDQMWLPVHRTWRLNERHYGGLTGLNKAETAEKHGEAQVKIWRRSYDTPPPPMEEEHNFYNNISQVSGIHTHTYTHTWDVDTEGHARTHTEVHTQKHAHRGIHTSTTSLNSYSVIRHHGVSHTDLG